jgi:hypothetical protein
MRIVYQTTSRSEIGQNYAYAKVQKIQSQEFGCQQTLLRQQMQPEQPHQGGDDKIIEKFNDGQHG